MRIADDHGLAAAKVHAGHGGLVRHATRQTQRVCDGVGIRCIGPHTGTAKGRTQRRVMDGNDGLEACDRIGAHDHLLVAEIVKRVEQLHRKPLVVR